VQERGEVALAALFSLSCHPPAHVIWGAEDAVLPTAIAERFITVIPGATRPGVIPGAGHFLQEDAPADVAAATARALTRDPI
jgi:pimeloyl-ACP methyl ester carboxylesterase